jgi:glutathione S-transferase
MRVRLFDWGPSPFCMKIRAILDYKGIAYERVNVFGAPLLEFRRRSPVGKVPALDIDGRLIADSTDIAYEIERLVPAPAIIPANAHDRGHSHVLEDWADEALYFLGLYFQWLEPRGKPMVRRAFGGSPFGLAVRVFYERRIARQLRGQGTARKPAAQLAGDLRRECAALADLLAGRPFLLGDVPYLCDFAVNAQLAYLSRPPASAEILAEAGVVRTYMERMRALRARPGALGGRLGQAAGD